MAQEYEQPVDTASESPRTQRMTAAESRAVIDLWQQERTEQTGLTDRPAVPDVAEGLDITVEDVQRLLSEVRARRLEEERALDVERELSEMRLAEEERKLAEVHRQRAALRLHQTPRQLVPRSQWVEIKPGIWEDAGLPGYSYMDFNQFTPNQQAAPHSRRGKPRQPAPVEWNGTEDFWQKTEEDIEAGKAYRADRAKQARRYVVFIGVTLLLIPVLLTAYLYIFGMMLK